MAKKPLMGAGSGDNQKHPGGSVSPIPSNIAEAVIEPVPTSRVELDSTPTHERPGECTRITFAVQSEMGMGREDKSRLGNTPYGSDSPKDYK
tara:strand:- start:59 stop:334 length:276 start_codon:yes stop_codon:yes gene_type:complete